MATKQQCDGCGNEHMTSKPFSTANRNLKMHKLFVAPEHGTRFDGDVNENFDLCANCAKSVVSYIKGTLSAREAHKDGA